MFVRHAVCFILGFCFISASIVGAEEPSKPSDTPPAPPEVEQALRARVNKFYQAHVEGKFRQADQVVADDSKDYFFEAPKPHYRKCNITMVRFSDNFTRAIATTACDTDFFHRGQRFPVTVPLNTLWKLENGEWFWYYVPPKDGEATPFGIMRPGPASENAGPAIPKDINLVAKNILQSVRIDKSAADFTHGPAAEEVHVKNGMPGVINIVVDTRNIPGLAATPGKAEVPANADVSIRISFDASVAARTHAPLPTESDVVIRVEETGQLLPIHVVLPRVTVSKDAAGER